MKKMDNTYYVYLHIRLDNNTVFYVGKGKKYRSSDKHGRSVHWHNIVKKHGYKILITHINLSNDFACKIEIDCIAFYNRATLTNQTNGGEGTTGWKCDQETKLKIGDGNRGKIRSEKVKKRLRDIFTGRKYGSRSAEIKMKISQKNSGAGNGMYGRKIKESSRQLQRDKLSGSNNYLSKLIFNTETGIYYDCLAEASLSCNKKKGSLWASIVKNKVNKTSFIYA